MLEKKERAIQKKISSEVEKAKDYTKLKNKKAAIQCLKKKRLYETQIEQLGNFQLRVHDQMIMVEGAKATTDTVDALKSGSAAIKSINKSLSVDEIEKTMEQVDENAENMRQIQEALATPVGAAANFDEDELEAELEELEELDAEEGEDEHVESLPFSVTAKNLPTSEQMKGKANRSDIEELTALQAEMAI